MARPLLRPRWPALVGALLACAAVLTPLAAAQDAPAPAVSTAAPDRAPAFTPLSPQERADLVVRLREHFWRDREREEQYTYLERRRDVRVSRTGKVSLGPSRTFEVYPSSVPGRTYKRLIEVEGVPLPPAELARRDAEHRGNMLWEKRRREDQTPQQQADRERHDRERRDRQRREVEEAFGVFDVTPAGVERLEGRAEPVLRVSLLPRRDAPAHSDLVRYLKRFEGTAWVDTAAGQLVRLDLRAVEDVTVGWGLVGRVHKGSTASYERQLVDGDAWLPWRARLSVRGRALLFRKFDIETETTWWDYRKYSVETRVIGP